MNPIRFGLRFCNYVMNTHVYEPRDRSEPGFNLHDAVEGLRERLANADRSPNEDGQDKVEIRFYTDKPTDPYVLYDLRKIGETTEAPPNKQTTQKTGNCIFGISLIPGRNRVSTVNNLKQHIKALAGLETED